MEKIIESLESRLKDSGFGEQEGDAAKLKALLDVDAEKVKQRERDAKKMR